jgi:FkbM family methyltransferase
MNRLKQATIRILAAILPQRLRNSILHLSYHLAPHEFERFSHTYCIGPNMNLGLRSLAGRGFSPQTIVDVGAYEGGWSKSAKTIWPNSTIIMFEPNTAKTSMLSKLASTLNGKLFTDLLGARSGEMVSFNLMETGSSIMNERSSISRKTETRILSTLDSFSANFQSPGLLKIDAQGYELEILKGAANSIKLFDAVLLEIALIEINEGAPLLHDVTAFMDELNFVACEVLETHRRPLDHAMSQIDMIFVRKGSALLSDRRYSA